MLKPKEKSEVMIISFPQKKNFKHLKNYQNMSFNKIKFGQNLVTHSKFKRVYSCNTSALNKVLSKIFAFQLPV